jgi:hypothetical protein
MAGSVTFPLESLPAAVTARTETWAALDVVWRVHPINPNHGKSTIISEFESETWLGNILIWISGEAELETIRLTDDRVVNKHYDPTHSGSRRADGRFRRSPLRRPRSLGRSRSPAPGTPGLRA